MSDDIITSMIAPYGYSGLRYDDTVHAYDLDDMPKNPEEWPLPVCGRAMWPNERELTNYDPIDCLDCIGILG